MVIIKWATKFGQAVDLIASACFRISMLILVIMMIVVSADAIARYALNSPIPGVYEITEDYLMVILVFFGLSHAFSKGAFIRVTAFIRHFHRSLVRPIAVFTLGISLAVFAVTTFGVWQISIRAFRTGEFSPNILQYPLAPAYLIAAFGMALLCIRLFQALFAAPEAQDQEDGKTPSV